MKEFKTISICIVGIGLMAFTDINPFLIAFGMFILDSGSA